MAMFDNDWRERSEAEKSFDFCIKNAPNDWGLASAAVKDTFHAMAHAAEAEGFKADQLLVLELTRLVIELRNFEKRSLPDDLE